MCSGGSTQVWPLTSERPRGRQVSLHPLPSPRALWRHLPVCPGTQTHGEIEEEVHTVPGGFVFFCLAWDCRQISDRGRDALFWHSGSEVAASGDCAVPRWGVSRHQASGAAAGARQSGCPEPGTPGGARPGWDQEGRACTPPPLPWRLEPLPQPQRQAELRGAWNRQGQPPPSRVRALCLIRPAIAGLRLLASQLFFP